jgi:hypothetical protein
MINKTTVRSMEERKASYYLPYNPITKKVIDVNNYPNIRLDATVNELQEDSLLLTLYCLTYEQAKEFQKNYKYKVTFRIINFPTTYIN